MIILGAIFLVAAIFNGIKAREIEVPPMSLISRILSAILGIVLIVVSVLIDRSNSGQKAAIAAAKDTTTTVSTGQSTSTSPPTTAPPVRVKRGTFVLKYTNYTAYLDLNGWKAYAGDEDRPGGFDGLIGININHARLSGQNGPQVALPPQAGSSETAYVTCQQVKSWKQSLDLAPLKPSTSLCLLSPNDDIGVIKVVQIPRPANDYIATLVVTLWRSHS